jgi:hypothetical protein
VGRRLVRAFFAEFPVPYTDPVGSEKEGSLGKESAFSWLISHGNTKGDPTPSFNGFYSLDSKSTE